MTKEKLETTVKEMAKEVSGHTIAIKELGVKVNNFDKRVDKLKKTMQNLILKVGKHSDRIEEMLTRKEFHEKMEQVIQGQDKILGIVTRLDGWRIFADARFQRIEEKFSRI